MEKTREYVDPGEMSLWNKSKINLIQVGDKYHSITLLKRWTRKKVGNRRKIFQEGICDCGTIRFFCKEHLLSGSTKSCGCVGFKKSSERLKEMAKHGMEGTRFYRKYYSMRNRCTNVKNESYHRYGGRGIKCLRPDFQSFMDDMYGSYIDHCNKYGADRTTIDRIDNNGDYCASNCKRSTPKEQQNNRSNNKIIYYKGSYMSVQQFCDKTGSKYGLINDRISSGRCVEDLLRPVANSVKKNRSVKNPLFITNNN